MNVIIFRYSPRVVMLNYADIISSIILAPSSQREKYNKFLNKGYQLPETIFLEDFGLPTVIDIIRSLKEKYTIDSITTLSEEDMDWVGTLEDYFVEEKSESLINMLFKDKYMMRSFLKGVVKQPEFKLIENMNDIQKFRDLHKNKSVIIKPRSSAGCENVRKFRFDEDIDQEYVKDKLNKSYLIEEFIPLDNMLTCDGYAVGDKVIRFFVHEYDNSILSSFNNLSDIVIRTSHLYNSNIDLVKNALLKVKKVIKAFSRSKEIVPFHFEWFYSEDNNDLVFCEVGKRFAGSDTPFLIKYSYEVDILKEYWDLINRKENTLEEVNDVTLLKPNVISATYTPCRKKGKIIEAPNPNEYNWAKNTWVFAELGDNNKTPTSITDTLLSSEFISNNEEEYHENLSKLRSITSKYKYEDE